MFHRLLSVEAGPSMTLVLTFQNGAVKKYDVAPLVDKWDSFKALQDSALFNVVRVDVGGYGVVWNDELDLSCEELWENGVDT